MQKGEKLMEKKNGRNEGYYAIIKFAVDMIYSNSNQHSDGYPDVGYPERIIKKIVKPVIKLSPMREKVDWFIQLKSNYFKYAEDPACVAQEKELNEILTRAVCDDIGWEIGYTICFEEIFNKKTKWD
jgi:hypothetical protein